MSDGIPESLTALSVAVDSLKPYGKNPRRGDVAAIARSLEVNGQYRPVVVNSRTSEVLAGNHTLMAVRQLGWPMIAATFVDADPEQAAKIVLVDNRSNDLAGYDDAMLLEILQSLPELDGTGYDSAALDELLVSITELPPALDDPDAVPDVPVEPVSVRGDVWLLGPHRLVCGDSSEDGVLDLLMQGEQAGCVLTDPPYGMGLDTDYSKMPGAGAKAQMVRKPKKYEPVAGDDEAFDAGFLRTYFGSVKEQFWFGADYYRSTLSPDDRDGSWLIWDKRKEDGSQDDVLGSSFETCWTAVPHQRRLLRHYWCGAFGAPEARNRMHPTQKPVGLMADILTRWSKDGCIVADPFAGSGSTLIACHTTGRIARLVELDPRYVDVICRRYQEATGTVPILESTSEPRDFTDLI